MADRAIRAAAPRTHGWLRLSAGLKGDEILPEARIIAVADVIEAMASHRPYRAGHGIEAALEEISSNRGTLYDQAIVDAALAPVPGEEVYVLNVAVLACWMAH